MDNLESAQEWLHFAQMDIQAAQFLLEMRPVPNEIICYHCQQCAEKSLKAILVKNHQEPRKIHDLVHLLQDVCEIVPELKAVLGMVAGLTDYSILTRYPPARQIDSSEASQAVRDAQKVFELCVAQMGINLSE